MTASKMFSKIRNRIRSKPLKINLKTSRPNLDEEPGLQPPTGQSTASQHIVRAMDPDPHSFIPFWIRIQAGKFVK